jgi:uncharacterized membrane protein SirB2
VYFALKHIHLGCAALSLGLFMLRGAWMFSGSPLLDSRFARVVPHVIDTMLLASAIGLMLVIRQYPIVQGWLTAKVVGLLVYIVLGTIALKRGRTRLQRSVAFFAALAVFAWIVLTARHHAPWLLAT